MSVVNQHFTLPFKWGANHHAEVVEQDSPEDITQCAEAVLATPRGFRLEIPDFGIIKPILEENGPNLQALRSALEEWEPRAAYALSDRQLEDILSKYVSVGVETKG